jgi:hypothetical protein
MKKNKAVKGNSNIMGLMFKVEWLGKSPLTKRNSNKNIKDARTQQ